MNYHECPHYEEMIQVLSEGRDFEDISFEIDEIHNCKGCLNNGGVCSLWVTLTFVEAMKPQMNITDAKATIDNLNKQISKIAMQLISNSKANSK